MEMSGVTPNILVVDDEIEVRTILRQALQDERFEVHEAIDKASALQCIESQPIDLITLDLRLGQESGLEVAREIRSKRNIPIVMISGRDAPLDRINGLEYGADDYITKPFHVREVLLRVRNVLKRYDHPIVERPPGAADNSYQYRFDQCVIDTKKRELQDADGSVVDLTDFEFRLLLLLVKNAARVLSRDEISRGLIGRDWSPLDRTIDGHIARLRRKLETSVNEPRLIKSVRGVGYVFAGEVSRL